MRFRNAVAAVAALVLEPATAIGFGRGSESVASLAGLPSSTKTADLHFPTRVDHFDSTNEQTWQQAYFVNDTYWAGPASGAPVLVFIGGEVPIIDTPLLQSNLVSDWLPATGAILFTLEHRYYGCYDPAACPFDVEDPAPNHLQYLSSRQSAADYAEFHRFATAHYGLAADTKWVVFGGSYPGMLAALLRAEYPDLFHSAVASSAPVRVELDFVEFEDAVADAYALDVEGVRGSPSCRDAITEGHREVRQLLADPAGQVFLAGLFNLTEPLDTETAQRSFAGCGVARFPSQGNNPRCVGPACGISQICEVMGGADGGSTILERLAAVRAAQGPLSGPAFQVVMEKCEMDSLWEMSDDIPFPMKYWGYQTCTEFGFYQTCEEGSRCMFSQGLISFNNGGSKPSDFCYKRYGVPFEETERRITENRAYFSGLIANATRIIWANGNADPWSALSHRSSPGRDQPVIWPIEGASHMAWLMPADPREQQSIKDARVRIYAQVSAWLGSDDVSQGNSPEMREIATELTSRSAVHSDTDFGFAVGALVFAGIAFAALLAHAMRQHFVVRTVGACSLQEPLTA